MSLLAIAGMSEDSAHKKFRDIIWEANEGRPVCPECGGTEVWVLRTDRRWKCSDNACRAQFSGKHPVSTAGGRRSGFSAAPPRFKGFE